MDRSITVEDVDDLWHGLKEDEVLNRVSSVISGLTSQEASKRLLKYGTNRLPEGRCKGALELLWQQLSNPIVGVLVAAAFIAFAVDPTDGLKNGLVIAAVVFINTLVGFIQEYKAERAIRVIAGLIPDCIQVLRDGLKVSLDATQLTCGDIVYLSSGDKVPADIRLEPANSRGNSYRRECSCREVYSST
jgi:magnesium-transporting ATPase (P-type)